MLDGSAIASWDCEQEVRDLCSQLIRLPSENPPGNVTEIAAFIQAYFERAGARVRSHTPVEGRTSVIAELGDGPGKTLILNGHMDVVPAGERSRWDHDPFGGEEVDGYIYGRGASDMKGGLAALMVALRRLAESADLPGRILFMAVPDEESGGYHGTRWLLDHGYSGDACLVAEPSGVDPTIGQKGSLWVRAVAHGKPGHSSLSPISGENAIRKMMRVTDAVYTLWDEPWEIAAKERALIEATRRALAGSGLAAQAQVLDRVSVNLGTLRGGHKVNVVPDRCEAEFDMRIPIGLSTAQVLDRLFGKLKESRLEDVVLEVLGEPGEANYTPPDDLFVQAVLRSIRAVVPATPRPLLQWATSDARFFRRRGIPTVQFGPVEVDGIHGYNERVKVSDLADACRVYALLAYDFLSEG